MAIAQRNDLTPLKIVEIRANFIIQTLSKNPLIIANYIQSRNPDQIQKLLISLLKPFATEAQSYMEDLQKQDNIISEMKKILKEQGFVHDSNLNKWIKVPQVERKT